MPVELGSTVVTCVFVGVKVEVPVQVKVNGAVPLVRLAVKLTLVLVPAHQKAGPLLVILTSGVLLATCTRMPELAVQPFASVTTTV